MTEFLSRPIDRCPVCGTWLQDAGKLRPCPSGPHHEDDYPKDAA